MLRGVLLLAACVTVKATIPENTCVGNGVLGSTSCIPAKLCQWTEQNISVEKHPKIRSFAASMFCPSPAQPEAITPTSSPTSTTEFEPAIYDYDSAEKKDEECDPIDPKRTSPKTGQKAWDKCVEYQEMLVYPCKKSAAMMGGYRRQDNCNQNADTLIVGGSDASKHEFPHMVLLGYQNGSEISWECGGSLISENFVLTAGHCVTNALWDGMKYASVGVLSRSAVAPSNTYNVKRHYRHPQYRKGAYNDIALIELEIPVKLDASILPACLHVGDYINDTEAYATGWGQLHDRGTSPSDVLQKVKVKKIPTSYCHQVYNSSLITRRFDNKTQLCYGDEVEKKDTCWGDSGGPLQIPHSKIKCMYLVFGITSAGRGCAVRKSPGLYSKVSNYIGWIESIVWP